MKRISDHAFELVVNLVHGTMLPTQVLQGDSIITGDRAEDKGHGIYTLENCEKPNTKGGKGTCTNTFRLLPFTVRLYTSFFYLGTLTLRYLTYSELIFINGRILKDTAIQAGTQKIRDIDLLLAAEQRPQASAFGSDAYPTLN